MFETLRHELPIRAVLGDQPGRLGGLVAHQTPSRPSLIGDDLLHPLHVPFVNGACVCLRPTGSLILLGHPQQFVPQVVPHQRIV
jgi:hypothetical protein